MRRFATAASDLYFRVSICWLVVGSGGEAKAAGGCGLRTLDGLTLTAGRRNGNVRGQKGEVALVEANPKMYVEKGRFKQPERTKTPAWPHPVVANGGLYLRDMDVLLCYDVAAPK